MRRLDMNANRTIASGHRGLTRGGETPNKNEPYEKPASVYKWDHPRGLTSRGEIRHITLI